MDEFFALVCGRAKQGLLSISFYTFLGLTFLWHNSYLDALNEEQVLLEKEVFDAEQLLSSVPRGTNYICSDGTVSYSSGSGTCSWHGGQYKSIARLQYQASIKPSDIIQEKKIRRENIMFWILVIGLFIAPSIDKKLKGRANKRKK